MRVKLIIALIFMSLTFQGCFFFILPIGAIVNAIRGPRYCVPESNAYVGSRITLLDGRVGTVTEIEGASYDCPNQKYPVTVKLTLDEEKKAEGHP